MMYYFAIDFFILLFMVFEKYKKLLLPLLFIVLFLFTAFRPGLGGWDYQVYKQLFDYIPDIFNFKIDAKLLEYEPLYLLFNSLVKTFTDNFLIFIIIYTFFTHLIMFSIIKKYSTNFFYSMFIYFSTYYLWHNFTLLRQNIAILVFWFSLKYIKQEKFGKYLFFILIATLFHKSAIILILFYFIFQIMERLSIKKNIDLIIFVSLLKPLSDYLLNIIYVISSYFGIGRSNLEAYLSSTSRGINPIFILESLIFITFIYFNRNNETIKKYKIFINCLLVTFSISVWFRNYKIFARFVEYFRIYYIILIPLFVQIIKNVYLKYSVFILTILYFFFRLIRYINSFDGGSLLNYTLF